VSGRAEYTDGEYKYATSGDLRYWNVAAANTVLSGQSTDPSPFLSVEPVDAPLAGVQRFEIDPRVFQVSQGQPATSLFVRAFARTATPSPACPSVSAEEHRKGRCISRYAFTNPIWARDLLPPKRSGLVWRDEGTGKITLARVHKGASPLELSLGQLSASFSVLGIGDFLADGTDEIFWRGNGGASNLVVTTKFKNAVNAGNRYFDSPGASWVTQGVGDLTGDGREDLLWREAGGRLLLWPQGDAANAVPLLDRNGQPMPLEFQVRGIGDYDRDKTADILWRSTINGNARIWYLRNGQPARESAEIGLPLSWQVQTVADFNGNGMSDVLLRAADGSLSIWFDNGVSTTGVSYRNAGGVVDSSWRVLAASDTNSDGRADILWQENSGALAIWYMNGAIFEGDAYPPAKPLNWKFLGVLLE
jgi:hypothetical protein